MAVSASQRRRVREIAGARCEYCGMKEAWEPFFTYHVEHVRAQQHGGSDDDSNLALACHHCNQAKGPNLTSIDPDRGEVTPLFHPRAQVWSEHFILIGADIAGLTPEGRTTVFLLRMNAPHRLELRQENLEDW